MIRVIVATALVARRYYSSVLALCSHAGMVLSAGSRPIMHSRPRPDNTLHKGHLKQCSGQKN